MNSMRRVVLGVLLVIGAVPGFAWAIDPATDSLIKKVEQHYNRANTLSVDFVEQYSVQGHPRPSESGTLTLQKQGKMRWDYAKPPGKLFVSDGKMIYLYTAPDNKVEEIPLRDTEDMRAPLAFLLGHLDLKKDFHDFALRPQQGDTWLEAIARSPKASYEKMQMLINARGEISRLSILSRDNSLLEFQLSREQVNPRVNSSLFAFKVPPGAEVVHALEFSGEAR